MQSINTICNKGDQCMKPLFLVTLLPKVFFLGFKRFISRGQKTPEVHLLILSEFKNTHNHVDMFAYQLLFLLTTKIPQNILVIYM